MGQAVAQSGRRHQHPVGVGGGRGQPVLPEDGHQLGAKSGHGDLPIVQLHRREEVGQGGGNQGVDRPAGLAGRQAGNEVGGGEDVTSPQAGAGQELGQRADGGGGRSPVG